MSSHGGSRNPEHTVFGELILLVTTTYFSMLWLHVQV